jgi:hypothetical protein
MRKEKLFGLVRVIVPEDIELAFQKIEESRLTITFMK